MPRGAHEHRDVVVIGGSAGGIEALRSVVEALPADLPAAVLVVVHVPEEAPSALAQVLACWTRLRATNPSAKEPLAERHLYVAPPGVQMIVSCEHSIDTLLALTGALWSAVDVLEERSELARRLATKAERTGLSRGAEVSPTGARVAEEREADRGAARGRARWLRRTSEPKRRRRRVTVRPIS